ncbi:hypothetical protein ACFXA3_00905 [Streptomyces sp. NPDC059456]|uniref:hypothetical protein n=1 Tax=Streptomyces sp. NPDC059456 TaxID=3346838 RepID=UPI0036B6D0D2
MSRTPDVVTLVSLDTHRLIVALPNRGPADVRSNLPRATAAGVLRHLADELDAGHRGAGQLPATAPAEAPATRTRPPTRRHCPAEIARHAADTVTHRTRELAGMLAAALDRGVAAEAASAGRHRGPMPRCNADGPDGPPRIAADDILDLAAARRARRTLRPRR